MPLKSEDNDQPPESKQYSELLYSHLSYEGAPNMTQAKVIAKATGFIGLNSFMLLPKHNRTVQVFPDPIHTIRNAVQSIIRLITGRDDNIKVRKAEQEMGRFGDACVFEIPSVEQKGKN